MIDPQPQAVLDAKAQQRRDPAVVAQKLRILDDAHTRSRLLRSRHQFVGQV
jgi:hypothetical protein